MGALILLVLVAATVTGLLTGNVTAFALVAGAGCVLVVVVVAIREVMERWAWRKARRAPVDTGTSVETLGTLASMERKKNIT